MTTKPNPPAPLPGTGPIPNPPQPTGPPSPNPPPTPAVKHPGPTENADKILEQLGGGQYIG